MMKTSTIARKSPRRSSILLMGWLVLVVLIPLAVSGCAANTSSVTVPPATNSAAANILPASELEANYGIRVTLIGITAAGGMVDFRYRVVDPDKATQWLKDPKLMPSLFVEDSGVILPYPSEATGELPLLKTGDTHYALYPNTGNAVKTGARVSVAIGDAHFGPFAAQQ